MIMSVKKQIECDALVDQRKRRRPVAGDKRLVAQAAELGDHIALHQRIVLDHQDRLAPTRRAGGMHRLRLDWPPALPIAAIELDHRTTAFFAVDFDGAAGLLGRNRTPCSAPVRSRGRFPWW